MKKILVVTLLVIGVTGSIGFVASAQTGTSASGNAMGTTDTHAMPLKAKILKGITALTATDLTCLIAAVDTRDTALGQALQTFDQAMMGAYRDRNTQVKAALALTDTKLRASGILAATTAFRTTTRDAQRAWRKDRNAAWGKFATARQACGASVAASQATGKGDDDANLDQ